MDMDNLVAMLRHVGLEPWPDGRSILDGKRPVDQHISMIVNLQKFAKGIKEEFCGLVCPSVWETAKGQQHDQRCKDLKALLGACIACNGLKHIKDELGELDCPVCVGRNT